MDELAKSTDRDLVPIEAELAHRRRVAHVEKVDPVVVTEERAAADLVARAAIVLAGRAAVGPRARAARRAARRDRHAHAVDALRPRLTRCIAGDVEGRVDDALRVRNGVQRRIKAPGVHVFERCVRCARLAGFERGVGRGVGGLLGRERARIGTHPREIAAVAEPVIGDPAAALFLQRARARVGIGRDRRRRAHRSEDHRQLGDGRRRDVLDHVPLDVEGMRPVPDAQRQGDARARIAVRYEAEARREAHRSRGARVAEGIPRVRVVRPAVAGTYVDAQPRHGLAREPWFDVHRNQESPGRRLLAVAPRRSRGERGERAGSQGAATERTHQGDLAHRKPTSWKRSDGLADTRVEV